MDAPQSPAGGEELQSSADEESSEMLLEDVSCNDCCVSSTIGMTLPAFNGLVTGAGPHINSHLLLRDRTSELTR